MIDELWDTGDIFENGNALTEEYTPAEIPERKEEIEIIAKGLGRIFRGETPKNMFLYGKTGQGKTVTARYVLDHFTDECKERGVDIETVYVMCRNHRSSYHVACELVERHTGENPNGHPQQKVFQEMFSVFESLSDHVIVILDEVDSIEKNHDILYNIPRARDTGDIENTKMSLIGITNDNDFLNRVDRRVQSSLYEEQIRFDVYDASDLRAILERRVKEAFRDGVVNKGTIAKCAATAAKDEGSARQAIEYMYEAGDIADFEDDSTVTEEHIQRAIEKVKEREVTQSITGLTLQDHLSLISVLVLETEGKTPARTRRAYTEYANFTKQFADTNTLTLDRYREHLKELDMLGILSREIKSGNEYGGEKYYWSLNVDMGATIDVLQDTDDPRVSEFMDYISQPDK